MIKTGVRYRCDRCGFERFVLDGSMSKAEKDKIAKEWFTVPDADGKEMGRASADRRRGATPMRLR